MLKKKVAICILAFSLVAAGCGQTKQASAAADSFPASESYAPLPSDTESLPLPEPNSTPVEDLVPAEPDVKPDEKVAKKTDSWVDVSSLPPADEVSTDSTYGEGMGVMPGTVVEVSDTSDEVKIGDTVTVDSPRGLFDLTIDSIRLTDERARGVRAERVVEVTYTYANTHDFEDLMVGDTSFILLDAQGKALAPYIFESSNGKHPNPEPIGSGEQFTTSIGFALPGDAGSEVTLIYKASYEVADSFEFRVKADL